MALRKFFGLPEASGLPKASRPETEAVRKIVQALDRLEPAQARFIAAFAYLLGRVAYADQNISMEETREMETLICERARLPEEQAILVVQIAKTQNLFFGGTENFLVSREFGRIATREEKLSLLDGLYSVAAADQTISVAEDNEIAQISHELNLEHEEFIAVRRNYREYLAVLKNPAPTSDS